MGVNTIREWIHLEDIVLNNKLLDDTQREITIAHLGNILGRTYDEVADTYDILSSNENPDRFFQIIYWLGKLAMNEASPEKKDNYL